MRRYYFDHAENGRFQPDPEGVVCADEAGACAVAEARIRRQVRRSLRNGSMPLGGYVSIRLGCGERVRFVAYRDAMTR